jgi:hypothetical protein
LLLRFEGVVLVLSEESAVTANFDFFDHANDVFRFVVEPADRGLLLNEGLTFDGGLTEQQVVSFFDEAKVSGKGSQQEFEAGPDHYVFQIEGKVFHFLLGRDPCLCAATWFLVHWDR